MLGNLLSGFITIVIGVNLLPPIADQVYSARYDSNSQITNVTGAASTIVSLIPLFFSLGIMTVGMALVVGGFRDAGVM